MTETVITSSALILIITALRYLLRGKISSRLQYAFWLLVAIRLLLPFSLFESPASIMNVIPGIQNDYSAVRQPVDSVSSSNTVLQSYDSPSLQSSQEISGSLAGTKKTTNGETMASFIWLSGLILSGAFFAASNIRLGRKLRRIRKHIEVSQCPLPVYIAEGLPSPCLYGIRKPAVYVTPESLSGEKRTEYVVAHELTHYCQKDHIWSFIRILCLCIHWFNPLVWMAVVLSRRDSELACDERTLRRIGPENRIEYGRTLIEMMTSPSKISDLFYCTTTMTGGKREMAERIRRIAKQPKTLTITLAVAVLAAAAAIALTFGSAAARRVPVTLPDDSKGGSITTQELWEARTPYVGDNSAVGTLLGLLTPPEGLRQDSFALRTAGKERGIEWILQGDDTASYEGSSLHLNALLLFALVDNLQDVYVTMKDPRQDETVFHYDRPWADEAVGCDVREYAKSPEKLKDLLDVYGNEYAFAQYSIAKLGENGKVLEGAFVVNQSLALAIINDVRVKSAAWEGVDITTQKECYLIRQIFPEALETHDFYAYLREDGTAVLQSGKNGIYSVLSSELYSELVKAVETLAKDGWRENKYTKGVPRPDFDNLVWMAPDDENGYCVAFYQEVSQEQIKQYVKTLEEDGWKTIQDLYEHPKLGGRYQKGSHTISLQFYDKQEVVLYFSLDQD